MTTALLLSGGMDSTAIAFWRRPQIALTIDYGQKPAKGEVLAASAICERLDIEHLIIRCDLSALGSGDLAGAAAIDGAPASEWWPYRNQMLVTMAAMACAGRAVRSLLIGALRTDGFHADGTPGFVDSMNRVLELQEGGLRLEAPAIGYDAMELIRISQVPLDILAWSHSCHVAEQACGTCRGCRKHYETYRDMGLEPY